jgi:hypothetical protein
MSDLTTQGATDAAEGLMALYPTGTARIGIGDSAAAFASSQTGLQGTNTAYKATSSVTRSSNRITAVATFLASEGNGFTVRELCVDRTTRMLVRNVPSVALSAKTSAEEWTFTIHIDFTAG